MQKELTKSELRNSGYDQTKFKFKSDQIQILNFQKHFWVGLLARGDHNEDVGVGFVEFGLTSKKLWSFETEGLICKKNYHK